MISCGRVASDAP